MTGKSLSSKNWTKENLAWMAGFFEGEGSFGFPKKGTTYTHPANNKQYTRAPYFWFGISQNERDVLETFERLAGGGKIYGPYNRVAGKPYWLYRPKPRDGYALIVAMWPWLHSKRRREAAAAIRAWILWEA